VSRARRVRHTVLALACAALVAAGCGKKGPPLPPLVLLPNAPGDFAAVRRGPRVDLTFRVPNANTDRSTPADLARLDIYAWTVPAPVSAEDVVRRGTRVGSLPVNAPPDPDESEPSTPRPTGTGLEQNAVVTFMETLPSDLDPGAYRTYVAVGINMRGRRGALSPRIAVPLVAPPSAPDAPRIEYSEKAITVSWPPVTVEGDDRTIAYVVYTPGPDGVQVTSSPVSSPEFADESIEWDKERCYEVRSVETVEDVRIESAASPSACITPHDHFAPAPPEGLVAVGSEAAVSLIWTANSEPDLAGYIVLRAVEPSTELVPITPAPITDSNFRDSLAAGSRAAYAVQAVDKTGNRSEPSTRVTESAR
jgi:hypothetical protein